ncbi:MAG: hypothetical protein NPIRA01_30470 [Nitrospirales bacterium]|nr:MAG: hypothetical protein NPIRA01_30470 [Nitrospirales bacterium]
MSAEGSGGVHVHQWPQALVDIPIGPCLVPSYPPWLGSLIKEIKPYHRTVQDSFRIRNVTHGTFTRTQAHDCLIQFYPLMETFPHWASLNVEKTSDCALRATLQRHVRAIKWQAHRWRQMAEGFGVSRQQLFETSIRMNVKVLNQYLWTVTHRQSLAESMMVLGYVLGGAVRLMAPSLLNGITRYEQRMNLILTKNTQSWVRSHRLSTGRCIRESLEIVSRHVSTQSEQLGVRAEAIQSLEFLLMALQASDGEYDPYDSYWRIYHVAA